MLLVTLFIPNTVSQWGVDVVLKRIPQDLTLLYNGVRIETSNGEIELFGAVIALCGDTLAQHKSLLALKVLVLPIAKLDTVNAPLKIWKVILMRISLLKELWRST